MVNVELVIKVPEDLYEAYKGRPPMLGDVGMDMIAQAIANGIQLPKGHGRLIDADELTKSILCKTFGLRSVDIENAPTIVEADRSEEKE